MKIGCILTLLAVVSLAVAPITPGPLSENAEMAYPEIPRITAEELKKLLDEKGEYVLLDVRDSYSYDSGHIEGAENISFDATEDPMNRGMMLMALPMETLIILYCD